MMHPDGSAEIESAIFETASTIESSEARESYLRRSFQGDSAGYARMISLLEVSGDSAAFFLECREKRAALAEDILTETFEEDSPHLQDQEEAALMKTHDGLRHYRLLHVIGEGGSGIVHEAQSGSSGQSVAIKILRLGVDTASALARFNFERQALELMDHPNIARILDSGKTSHGRPYLAIELVRGTRITTFCEEHALSIRDRIELFLIVCDAIQYAHQQGIIHRDIKPSNVLVSREKGIATPKVIDFGIAKGLSKASPATVEKTAADQLLGTPAYMSPEQVDMGGRAVDTRSDIYSLGALLYELLSGFPPFEIDKLLHCGISEMRRTILEKNPPLPSMAAQAFRRRDKTGEVPRSIPPRSDIRGDLDWITMKALEKDRARRYQSVGDLARDLRRFLSHQPVSARRPSRAYLLSKLYQRNRVACISGIAAVFSLLIGLGTATTLYFREKDALAAQERLGREAESARAEESRLRKEAQDRVNVSRAAMLLSEGKILEADNLLRETPLSSIAPSDEAATVFRSLGTWNAIYGRWKDAAGCFRLLNQANRLASKSEILKRSDFLMIAPAFLEAGDIEGYRSFRAEALSTYLPVHDPLEAEHMLKACLLEPADQGVLNQLEPVARICREKSGANRSYPAWDAFALALFYYRKSDFPEAIRYAQKSLSYPAQEWRSASVLSVSALAKHRMGDKAGAKADLKTAKELIDANDKQMSESRIETNGKWHTWSAARILQREARGLIND